MPDDLASLEHRIDGLESWRSAQEAVAQAKSAADQAKHNTLQIFLSVISSLTMLVNLYLTLSHRK